MLSWKCPQKTLKTTAVFTLFIVSSPFTLLRTSQEKKNASLCYVDTFSSRANLITFELLYYFLSPHSPHILNLVLPIAVPSAGCNELVLCAYKPCLMMLDWIVLGSLQSAILDSTAKSATTQRSAANPPAFHLSARHCDQRFQPWSTEWSWV